MAWTAFLIHIRINPLQQCLLRWAIDFWLLIIPALTRSCFFQNHSIPFNSRIIGLTFSAVISRIVGESFFLVRLIINRWLICRSCAIADHHRTYVDEVVRRSEELLPRKGGLRMAEQRGPRLWHAYLGVHHRSDRSVRSLVGQFQLSRRRGQENRADSAYVGEDVEAAVQRAEATMRGRSLRKGKFEGWKMRNAKRRRSEGRKIEERESGKVWPWEAKMWSVMSGNRFFICCLRLCRFCLISFRCDSCRRNHEMLTEW